MISIFFNEQLPRAQKEFKYYCFHNCFRKILAHYDNNCYELLLDHIMSINCRIDEDYDCGYRLDSVFGMPKLLADVDGQSVIFRELRAVNAKQVLDEMDKLIKENIPVVIAHDSFFLDYTVFYCKAHFMHAFIYCGSEYENMMVIDDDWMWQYKGALKKTTLLESMRIDHLGSLYGEWVPEYMFAYILPSFPRYDRSELIILNMEKMLAESKNRINQLSNYLEHITTILRKKHVPTSTIIERLNQDSFDLINAIQINNYQFKIINEISNTTNSQRVLEMLLFIEDKWETVRNKIIREQFREKASLLWFEDHITDIIRMEKGLLTRLQFLLQ